MVMSENVIWSKHVLAPLSERQVPATLAPAVLKPAARAALVDSWYVSLLKSANPLTLSRLTEPTVVQSTG